MKFTVLAHEDSISQAMRQQLPDNQKPSGNAQIYSTSAWKIITEDPSVTFKIAVLTYA